MISRQETPLAGKHAQNLLEYAGISGTIPGKHQTVTSRAPGRPIKPTIESPVPGSSPLYSQAPMGINPAPESLSGTVLNSVTHEPIGRALV
jgi:hypothetical protein